MKKEPGRTAGRSRTSDGRRTAGSPCGRPRRTGDAATLSHVDREGHLRMVDVSGKEPTVRTARAAGTVTMSAKVTQLLRGGGTAKGNVLAAAHAAGVMAAKRTPELIPLCHPLLPEYIGLDFALGEGCIEIRSCVRLTGRTGAEMEALTAVAVAALTIYDMCKAVDKRMVIGGIRLLEKTGGKSGTFRAPGC
jgi:cyclic pyranopterin monophosphate synthase